eukprot:scaffold76954_cov69-Phaeocystis_antarctica.AAC.2
MRQRVHCVGSISHALRLEVVAAEERELPVALDALSLQLRHERARRAFDHLARPLDPPPLVRGLGRVPASAQREGFAQRRAADVQAIDALAVHQHALVQLHNLRRLRVPHRLDRAVLEPHAHGIVLAAEDAKHGARVELGVDLLTEVVAVAAAQPENAAAGRERGCLCRCHEKH